MRIHRHSFLLPMLAATCFTAAQAQEHAHDAFQLQEATVSVVKGGQWSDPSTWAGGAVPAGGHGCGAR